MIEFIAVDGMTISMTGNAAALLLGLKIDLLTAIPTTTTETDTVSAVPSQVKFTIGGVEVLIDGDVQTYVSGLTLKYITTLFATTGGVLALNPLVGATVSSLSTITKVDSDFIIIKTTTWTFGMSNLVADGGLPAQNVTPVPDTPANGGQSFYVLDVTITDANQVKAKSN